MTNQKHFEEEAYELIESFVTDLSKISAKYNDTDCIVCSCTQLLGCALHVQFKAIGQYQHGIDNDAERHRFVQEMVQGIIEKVSDFPEEIHKIQSSQESQGKDGLH